MKCADKIFTSGEIHADLAAHGAIDLREERSGHLHKIHAAQVCGGHESGQVADNAPAEGNDERAALDAVFGKLIVTRLYVFERLGLFPGGLANEDGRKAGGLERGEGRFEIVTSDGSIGDDRTTLAELETGAVFAEIRKQPRRDVNRVRSICQRYLNRAHGGLGARLFSGVKGDALHTQTTGFAAEFKFDFLAGGAAEDGLSHRGEVADDVFIGISIPRAE